LSSFDLDYPTDCDDEYWDLPDPEQGLRQPEGKPSKMTFFIQLLKLMDLYAYAMRRIVRLCFSLLLTL
jgi:hypothetical protein